MLSKLIFISNQVKKFYHHSQFQDNQFISTYYTITHGLTCVMAKQDKFFLCTTRPRRALFLTIQYGTPIFLHSAGKNRTICKQKLWKLSKIITYVA